MFLSLILLGNGKADKKFWKKRRSARLCGHGPGIAGEIGEHATAIGIIGALLRRLQFLATRGKGPGEDSIHIRDVDEFQDLRISAYGFE